MIISVWLKTESGDNYLYLKEVSTETEMLAEIVLSMDTELAFVYDYEIRTIGGCGASMQRILQDQINFMQDLEDELKHV